MHTGAAPSAESGGREAGDGMSLLSDPAHGRKTSHSLGHREAWDVAQP